MTCSKTEAVPVLGLRLEMPSDFFCSLGVSGHLVKKSGSSS